MGIVYIKRPADKSLLGFWDITESLEDLHAQIHLSDTEMQIFDSKRTLKRKKEWLAVRCLLKTMLPGNHLIKYDADGKPLLAESGYHISISHSDLYATLYVHPDQEIGVDVQKVKNDIHKGTDFFINREEQKWVNLQDNILLHLIWSLKESIFKCIGIKDLNVKNQVYIFPFEPSLKGKTEAQISYPDKTQKVVLAYEIFEDYVLTYTL